MPLSEMHLPKIIAAFGLLCIGTASAATPSDPANFAETSFISSATIASTTGIAWAPDGSNRLFVIRKAGEVRVVYYNPATRTGSFDPAFGAAVPPAWATITPIITTSECGLIGLCFDPNFINNRYVYFFVTVSATEQQIIRYTDNPGTAAGSNKTTLVAGLPTAGANHDGGAVGIGPDGRLYWAIGDNGNGTGVNTDLLSLGSKIGRVNRFTGAAANDNPFFGQGNANTDKIWARGFRNPFTFTFQPGTGQLWSNTVGTNWEQVFVPQRGSHAGYNTYENNQPAGFLTPAIAYRTNSTTSTNIAASGAVRTNGVVTITTTATHPFRKGGLATIAGVTATEFNGTFAVASVPGSTQFTFVQAGSNSTSGSGTATTQNIGGAITGGCFYDSTAFPAAYRGNFFFGDYNSGRIMRVTLDAQNSPSRIEEFVTGHATHVDMTTGPDGAIYYVNQGNPGVVRRLAFTGTTQEAIIQPTAFDVVEGGSSVFSVRLRAAPVGDVNVTVTRIAGDADLTVSSGATLTFTPANFNVPKLVTIGAAEDADLSNDSATFRVAAPGVPGYDVIVNGIDNDEPQLVISGTSLAVTEGGSNTFTVRLASAPAANVTVTSSRTAGDSDVTVTSGASLVFTSVNFATPQTVQISAAQDPDNAADAATITVSAPGETPRQVAILVTDDDPLAPAFATAATITGVVGAAYSYDADVTGNPLPTFSLMSAPSGMSINPASGAISWLPGSTGVFAVTVQAANGVLPNATQSFNLTVNADAPPAVVLTRPIPGEILSGTNTEFFGDALDDVGTVKAEFFVDGILRSTDVNNGGHYHFGGAHLLFNTTPFTNGAHTVEMRVTDTKGQTGSTQVQVTISNGADAWRAEKFNLGNPADLAASALHVDADGDGLLNLYEYATDSAPKTAGLARLPVRQLVNVSGSDYLALQFVMAKWATDVTFRVEATSDLGALWTQIDPANPTYLINTQDNVPAFGLTTVTVRDIVPIGTDPRYMRLRVTK